MTNNHNWGSGLVFKIFFLNLIFSIYDQIGQNCIIHCYLNNNELLSFIWDYFRPGVSWEIIGFNWIYRKTFTHKADTNDPFNKEYGFLVDYNRSLSVLSSQSNHFSNNVIDFLRPIEFLSTLWRLLSIVTCWRTLRGQTAFCECKRIPQQAKSRFVAESATLIFFFDLLCCFGFHEQIAKILHRSKLLRKQANLGNLQPNCGESGSSLWSPQAKNDIYF